MKADADNDGRVSLADFTAFCTIYPQMLDTMFFKISNPATRTAILHCESKYEQRPFMPQRTLQEVRETTTRLEMEKSRADALRHELLHTQQSVVQLENDVKSIATMTSHNHTNKGRALVELQRTDTALEAELTTIRQRYQDLQLQENDLLKRKKALHDSAYFVP